MDIPHASMLRQTAFVHRLLREHVLVHHPHNILQYILEERKPVLMVGKQFSYAVRALRIVIWHACPQHISKQLPT